MPLGRSPSVIVEEAFDRNEDKLSKRDDVATSRKRPSETNCRSEFSSSNVLDDQLEKHHIGAAAQEDEDYRLQYTIHLDGPCLSV